MTPTRVKRSSKAPNRFSSDNSRIETSNSNGETIIDYNDKSTSTTHSLAPIGKTIKLKPVMREPLKVKLPKLKRLPQSQSTKEHTVRSNNTEIKIHKIKLPSFSSKKSTTTISDIADPQIKTKSTSQRPQSLINMEQNNSVIHDFHPKSISQAESHPPIKIAKHNTGISTGQRPSAKKSSSNYESILETPVASKAPTEDRSFSSANTSISSSDDTEHNTPRMEIVVSHPDQTNGSGIRCPCGVDDDLGVMVECESCSTWQHGHCINVGTEDEAYEGYVCAYCILPADQVRESLRQLTVDDKFLSRFKQLESLAKQNDHLKNSSKEYNSIDTAENGAQFTAQDLSQAIRDLYRVLSSLRVKWALLTNQEYGAELRIWQNPVWHDGEQDSLEKDKSIYFLYKCKTNLKLNIRNMVKKMDERCRLIDIALSSIEAREKLEVSGETELEVKKIRQSLEEIANRVREYEVNLKNLSN